MRACRALEIGEIAMGYTRVGDYLVGLIGLALLRSRVTDLGGMRFCDARIAELRRILEHWEDPALQAQQTWVDAPASEGYAVWASTYDRDDNPLVDIDNAVLGPRLDRYPPGRALDAACGTGRWAAYLSERGHDVRGVDQSPEMLAVARCRHPYTEFVQGNLEVLPVPDASVDLVVCALALTHIADLTPVFREFMRVLRPGSAAVVSNIHHLSLPLGGVIQLLSKTGQPIQLPASLWRPTDYIMAALNAGFDIRGCAEESWPEKPDGHGGPTAQAWCPEAARAASAGTPALMVLEVTSRNKSR
jgi:SAM-dependent methyltransferase